MIAMKSTMPLQGSFQISGSTPKILERDDVIRVTGKITGIFSSTTLRG
jgi:hypothetical protein